MKNSSEKYTIEHKGVVQKNDNESVSVLITSGSACSGCHAESVCSLAGSKEKLIEVKGSFKVSQGDNVIITMKQSSGARAVTMGYVIPLILVLTALIILLTTGFSEVIAAAGALSILVPYYVLLYLFRHKINEKFAFSLKI